MSITRRCSLSGFALLAACGAAPTPSARPTARTDGEIVPTPGSINRPAPSESESQEPEGGGEAGRGRQVISLAPGFSPDPILVRGRLHGGTRAERSVGSCVGFIDEEPSALIKVEAAVPGLRVLAHGAADTTLVVQLEDGRVLCNDDTEGLDPVVAEPIPPGRHRVWVGSFAEVGPDGLAYTLGFTAQRGVTCQSLDSMPQSP